MEEPKSIYVKQNYGKIVFHIKEIMDKKNITRNTLARLIDVRFEVADKWYKGEIERMDIDVLTRICYVLDCEVSDLIEYVR